MYFQGVFVYPSIWPQCYFSSYLCTYQISCPGSKVASVKTHLSFHMPAPGNYLPSMNHPCIFFP